MGDNPDLSTKGRHAGMGETRTTTMRHENAFDRGLQRKRKHEAVLEEAARLFNRHGYTGTTLDDLAERMGVTKAALYYYVNGKEDLGVQSYRRTLERQRTLLERAAREGRTGLERVSRYILLVCEPQTPSLAIVNEAAALAAAARRQLDDDARANARMMRAFITEGIADGSIAPCDPALTALAINGALSWLPLWYRPRRHNRPRNVGPDFADIIANGIRAGGASRRLLAPIVASAAPGRGIFDRKEQARHKREALLKAATAVFNRKGYSGASLNEVVRSLNVTKGAFYHYVNSKDDLLLRCHERSLDMTIDLLRLIDERGENGWAKVELSIRSIIELHCGTHGPIAIFSGLNSLSKPKRAHVADRFKRAGSLFMGFVREGVDDGSIRECDNLFAYGAIVGSTVWLPKWYTPAGSRSPAEIADSFCALFSRGLGGHGASS